MKPCHRFHSKAQKNTCLSRTPKHLRRHQVQIPISGCVFDGPCFCGPDCGWPKQNRGCRLSGKGRTQKRRFVQCFRNVLRTSHTIWFKAPSYTQLQTRTTPVSASCIASLSFHPSTCESNLLSTPQRFQNVANPQIHKTSRHGNLPFEEKRNSRCSEDDELSWPPSFS